MRNAGLNCEARTRLVGSPLNASKMSSRPAGDTEWASKRAWSSGRPPGKRSQRGAKEACSGMELSSGNWVMMAPPLRVSLWSGTKRSSLVWST